MDRKVLCMFRKNGVCSDSRFTNGDSLREVRKETVKRQVDNSYRSVERLTQHYAERQRRIQEARCANVTKTLSN